MLKKVVLSIFLLLSFISFSQQNDISLISWNIQDFGKTKSNEELDQIATIVNYSDIVAIQEVVAGYGGAPTVAKLADILNRKGNKWDYVISNPTNSSKYTTERYAFIWKTERIQIKNRGRLMTELDSLVDREPFQMDFYIDGQKLSLINFHSRPHNKNPKAEITAIIKYLEKNMKDTPLILAGDFNVDEKDVVFDDLKILGFRPAVLNKKTTLKRECNLNRYLNFAIDNIFYSNKVLKLEGGTIDFVKFCENLNNARKISDHIPVYLKYSL